MRTSLKIVIAVTLWLCWSVWRLNQHAGLQLIVPPLLQSQIGQLLGDQEAQFQTRVDGFRIAADERSMDCLCRLLQFERLARDVCIENLTNVNNCHTTRGTPYRRKIAVLGPHGVCRVELGPEDFKWVYDPSHPMACKEGDNKGYLPLPNVDVERELLALAQHQRVFQAYSRALVKLEALRPDLVVVGPCNSERSLQGTGNCLRWLAQCQDVCRQNLKNAATPGYRRESLALECFQEGRYKVTSITHLSQGLLKKTDVPLHLALDDNGRNFFTLQAPRGHEYTRQGLFHLSTTGHLVSADGSFLLGRRGPIRIAGNSFQVSQWGQVRVDGREVDRLLLCYCPNERDIIRLRDGNFYGNLKPAEAGARVRQGYLEQSNVNPIGETIRLNQTSQLRHSVQYSLTAL